MGPDDVELREALSHATFIVKSCAKGPTNEDISVALRKVEAAVQQHQLAHKTYHGTITRDLDSSGWRLHWISKAKACTEALLSQHAVIVFCFCIFQAVRALQEEIFKLGEYLVVLKSAPTNAAALAGVAVLELKLVDLRVMALSLVVC